MYEIDKMMEEKLHTFEDKLLQALLKATSDKVAYDIAGVLILR